jgi:hypothetical protein
VAPQILGATWQQSGPTIGEKTTEARPDQSVITYVQKGNVTGLVVVLRSIVESIDSSICKCSLAIGTEDSQVCICVDIPTRRLDAKADSALYGETTLHKISDDWSPVS